MNYSLLAILAILTLSSCAIQEANRVESIRQKTLSDQSISNEIRSAILNKQIMVGMTKQQVLASWGQPCGLCYGTRRSSAGDTWEYNPGETTSLGIGIGTYLYFDVNGILRYWSGP